MPELSTPILKRIAVANRVLSSFAQETHIERRRGGWYVVWSRRSGETLSRRWLTRGQDFYPPWSHAWGHGGTACNALAQLIRWLRGQAVLPISTWEWWANERVKLVPADAVQWLSDGGYPATVPCVLCNRDLTIPGDWWSVGNVSGPCCSTRSGCQQRRPDIEEVPK